MTDATQVTDGPDSTGATDAQAAVVRAALAALADPARALGVARFFQTGQGEYGEGDVFIGLRVPMIRQVVKRFAALPLPEIDALITSEIHEHRLAALLILVKQFERASSTKTRDDDARTRLADFYIIALRRGNVNSWDLVDASAPTLIGQYFHDRPRQPFFDLAGSDILWQRRVAMVGTYGLILRGDATTTLELAALLLGDREPLMHKAVGWMLREVGKRIDRTLLLEFLDEHAARMPRTALSYATEHLDPDVRARYRAMTL